MLLNLCCDAVFRNRLDMNKDGRSYLHQNKTMDIQILNNTMGKVETVADPGFPVGGANHQGGADIQFGLPPPLRSGNEKYVLLVTLDTRILLPTYEKVILSVSSVCHSAHRVRAH